MSFMCSRCWSFLKSYLLQQFPQSNFLSLWFCYFLLCESSSFHMTCFSSLSDCTWGQPGRKKWEYCSLHSAPSSGWALLGRVLILICPLLPWGTVPCWHPRAFCCPGPLSSFPPTSSSHPDLSPGWFSFLAVWSPLPTFGVLYSLPLTRESPREPCMGAVPEAV